MTEKVGKEIKMDTKNLHEMKVAKMEQRIRRGGGGGSKKFVGEG